MIFRRARGDEEQAVELIIYADGQKYSVLDPAKREEVGAFARDISVVLPAIPGLYRSFLFTLGNEREFLFRVVQVNEKIREMSAPMTPAE